jgi:8-oxo-dGTP pyrophosphatase MutT (NUDIX family)
MMVQRKDSLSYVEFLRGKYDVQDREYIQDLLSNMTAVERERLGAVGFDELWRDLWQCDYTHGFAKDNRGFAKEYEHSRSRFQALAGAGAGAGAGADGETGGRWCLAQALAATRSTLADTEFGFPKGRRNINETDQQCALREFAEEAGVPAADIQLLHDVPPFEEVFLGSNKVQYRHVYFLARLKPGSRAWADPGGVAVPVVDPVQLREVKATGWFGADDVLARIRPANRERRALFQAVHARVCALGTGSGSASCDL